MKQRYFFVFIIITGLLVNASQSHAQKKIQVINKPGYDVYWFHFGIMLGLNVMDFSIHPSEILLNHDPAAPEHIYAIIPQRNLGFNINIVTNLRLGDYWDLRFTPGLAFGQRDLAYKRDTIQNGIKTESWHTMKIESTFLQLPFLIKYRSARVNNYRPYLIAGLNPSYDLESQKKIKAEEMPKIRLVRPDLYFELGFGIDYYMVYFKFSTELKLSIGLNDVVKEDETIYTKAIDKMTSKILTLGFYFE